MAVKIDNIMAGLASVQNVTDNYSNLSHNENVPINLIFPAKFNPYNEDDTEETTQALADSISANGLLHPITVNKVSANRYEIISGEHRFKAISQYLDWKTIPCTVFDNISSDEAELKLHIANLDAREYTPAQKLKYYEALDNLVQRMIDNGEYSGSKQKAIANIMKVSTRQVRKYKSIVENLTPQVKEKIQSGEVTIEGATKLAASKKAEVTSALDKALSSIDNLLQQDEVDKATPQKHIKIIVKRCYNLADCHLLDDVDRAVIGAFIDQLNEIANKYELEV